MSGEEILERFYVGGKFIKYYTLIKVGDLIMSFQLFRFLLCE